MAQNKIVIKGAREHNLKNIDVEIPRDKLVVLTGLSGSGKSSLAFDTIYAEGQRRYVESLSAYARQFLGQMNKPDLDYIEGLSPAISIDQKTTSKNPRSTVGTITEIYDYMRLLYARAGIPHCPKCGREIHQQTTDQMVDKLMQLPERTRLQVMAPVIRGRKGEHQKLFENIKKNGFVRVRVDGEVTEVSEDIQLDKNKKHNIEIVIDRIIVKEGIESRLSDSLEIALHHSEGLVIADVEKPDGQKEEMMFSENFACPDCNISIGELEPRMFSFNNPFGKCQECDGLGSLMELSPDLIIPDRSKSINDGGVKSWTTRDDSWTMSVINALAKHYNFSLDTPIDQLPDKIVDILLYGNNNEKFKVEFEREFGKGEFMHSFEGVINNLNRRYKETNSDYIKNEIEGFMTVKKCPKCNGARLKAESLAVTVGDLSIDKVCEMPIRDEIKFFQELKLSDRDRMIADQIFKEIKARLNFLVDVGLDYLTLSRASATLSGGESQRIRLATQIGSSLIGVLYILDEPSIGLHQRDNDKLLKTLKHLRDIGNTLIVVEHDEDTIREADYVIDIGPGAGAHGGYIIAQGTPEEICANEASLTGQYLSGQRKVEVPSVRNQSTGHDIVIKGARENNLKNIEVKFPTGIFTAVTGVSGSGKSTLVNEILYKGVAKKLFNHKEAVGAHDAIEGLENIDKIIDIDQSPIGRTPRSNPATYTGVFDMIRDVFAQTNEAKIRGYKNGRFSFNVKGGRCEACSGDGILKIEMQFLSDVYIPCDVCKGKRYNRETLEVRYKGKNIAEVLDMTVEESLEFFDNIPRIKNKLKTLHEVGLSYVKLGQPSTQLSGGEAQRVKLATELSKRSTGKTLYILDEPTTGLHMEDVSKLVEIIHKLVEGGNTVIVIEHNLDVIKCADHIVDLGPEGGDKGGMVVAQGTPEQVAKNKKSYTGEYLKRVL